ncbi:MAG: HD-GYP domain-containing protein [Nitrospiraceae bacterium]
MIKTIDVDQLKPGMFIERLDRSWFTTPFFRHRFLLKDDEEITLLKRNGVRRVVIDLEKGQDVDEPLVLPSEQAPVPKPTISSEPVSSAPPEKEVTRRLSREEIKVAQHVHAEAMSTVQSVLEGFNGAARPNGSALLGLASQMQKFLQTHRSGMITAMLLRQMREYDETLFSHVVDVGLLSMIVGIDQKLSSTTLEHLAVGAMLHDIGELRLPRNVFRTTGTGDERERTLKHQHPAIGLTMLSRMDEISDEARRIVVEHHERIDGSGYPAKLQRSSIASLSQLVSLIDAYVTLITSRGGRPAISPPQAIRHLYQLALRLQFDQTLVEQMIHSLGVYPIGSFVELNTGEQALVVDVHTGVTVKPWVKLLSDTHGQLLTEPFVLDLADPNCAIPPREIIRDLNGGMDRLDIAKYLEN